MPGATRCAQRNAPVRVVAMTHDQSSKPISAIGACLRVVAVHQHVDGPDGLLRLRDHPVDLVR